MEKGSIGEVIRGIMKRKGIGIKELGGRMGVSEGQIQSYLKRDMRVSTLVGICNAIGVEIGIIDGWEKERLGKWVGNEDIDLMIKTMNTYGVKGSEIEDRAGERIERRKETQRRNGERLKEQMKKEKEEERKIREKRARKTIAEKNGWSGCERCSWCEKGLKNEEGWYWCRLHEEWDIRIRCEDRL